MAMHVPNVTKVQSKLAYKSIRDEAGVRELHRLLSTAEVCAVDTEANNKDPQSALLLGVAFSVNAGEAFYVPVTEGDLIGLSTEQAKAGLQRLLGGSTRFVGHNIKFDCVLLRRHGITVKHVHFDTMLAAYECFGDWEFFNLSALAEKLLGKAIKRYRDIVGERETLLDVPFNELVEHGCADADTTLQLYHRLKQELENRNLSQQFSGQTMALLRTLVDKECNGVRLSIKAINRQREALAEEVNALRKAVTAEAGREFDLDSPLDTASALRGISSLAGRVGRRVTLIQLEELAGTHTLPRLIAKYRRAKKLGRELETVCAAVKHGRVFPIFNQIRWAHGSLSSTHPRICDAGGPLDAGVVIDRTIREHMADADRALYILQRITGDEVFEKDWHEGGDRPSFIGGCAAERNLDQKHLLLSVVIGFSDAALSSRFLINRFTAAGIRQALEGKYAKLFRWRDIYRLDTLTQGYAQHNGRLKYLEGLKSSDLDKRQKALRSAVRWLIRY
jgi:DNA polymerase-1